MGPLQLCNSLHIVIVLCSATSTSSMAGVGSGTNKALTRLQTPIVPVPTGKWVPTHLCLMHLQTPIVLPFSGVDSTDREVGSNTSSSNTSPNTNSASTDGEVGSNTSSSNASPNTNSASNVSNTSSSNASPNTNSANNVSNTSSSNASPNTNSAPPSNATPNTNSASNLSAAQLPVNIVLDLCATLCTLLLVLLLCDTLTLASALGLALTQTTLVHMANPNSIVCQFMEDALAAKDRICECPSCRAQIAKGQPCFYVATMQPGRSGRNKPTTSQPALRQHLSSTPASQRWPDPKVIRQSVNASQRKSSVNPPRVVAIPDWTNTSMGPPPVPLPRDRTTGPDVAVPMSWQGLAASPIPSRLTGPIGYSAHHGSYSTEYQRWSKLSYATPGGAMAETISLEISAIHEAGGHKKSRGTLIGNICEGKKDIDAQIDAPGLINLAMETVLPKLHAFGGTFSWREHEFIVRDLKWVLAKAPIFKMKQFGLMVVVPKIQWTDFEDWQEANEMAIERSSRQAKGKGKADPLFFADSAESLAYTYSTDPPFDPTDFNSADPPFDSQTAPNHQFDSVDPPFDSESALKISSAATPVPALSTSSTAATVPAPVTTTTKRTHERAISITSSPSPPRKHNLVIPLPVLCSPDRDDLRIALKIGGGADLDMQQGGFKTAHTGWLTLMSPPTSGLGSRARHDIVVKRPFEKLFREANILYWAKALLGLVYDVIDRAVAGASEPVPFNIPRVRFVEAGLALSYYQDSSKPALKYIHNMDPNPLLDPDEPGYDFALFLAFTQHVQYVKTGGLVFISDYQGNTELLTDPQIMTHPSVSDKKDIFGGGQHREGVLKLLLPTVEILSLDLSSSFRKAIIPILPTSAPRLKALELKGSLFMTDKNPSEIESLLTNYPDCLAELSLTCHWHDVPSTVLNVIAPWPSLRSLTLKLGLESIPTAPLRIPKPFAALTHLHISSDDTLDLFISFLRTFRILNFDSSNTTSLNLKTIQFIAEGCSPANTWSQLLTSLTHTNAKLEHIMLTEKSSYEYHPHSSFDFRLLLAHQSLTRLNTLVLSPGRTSSITLTDADILTLARTCPHLHVFDLGLRNTPVSLHALNILVRRCRELRQVSFCVDGRVDALGDGENEDEVGLQPNARLITLEVGNSPVAYVGPLRSSPELKESIPRFLHAMAPRLKSVTDGLRSHGTRENPWEVVSYALWMMVTDEEDD
ncbi:hypothetical protein DFJ58DRAFT_748303 [Suillus subalutaceus]|uniref:uncharacterized protein n=1 Tax=Suillus subalutaceus TaxID=48586 RepID=UPI001B87470A|nr:uncharacterized protein DFJ58DRAFT_748303 [Suillus subalutaceus]KAG1842048.1 hypothetical protein DFJ58DRAFT_748303 [Suillus subalutaceus]